MKHLVQYSGQHYIVESRSDELGSDIFLQDLVDAINGNAWPDECLTIADLSGDFYLIMSFEGEVIYKNQKYFDN